jgi:hypothetical protein
LQREKTWTRTAVAAKRRHTVTVGRPRQSAQQQLEAERKETFSLRSVTECK